MINRNHPLTRGHQGHFPANGNRCVLVRSNGRVDRAESKGVDREADGFVASIEDVRLAEFILHRHPASLGGKWHLVSQDEGKLFADCGDERVWKHGGTQQVDIDFRNYKVTLETLGSCGEHLIEASFFPSTGRINPRTITEQFLPRDCVYEAMMRDAY